MRKLFLSLALVLTVAASFQVVTLHSANAAVDGYIAEDSDGYLIVCYPNGNVIQCTSR